MVLVLIRVWLGLVSARGSGMGPVCASAHGACGEGGNEGLCQQPEPGPCQPLRLLAKGRARAIKCLSLSCTGDHGQYRHFSVPCCHFILCKIAGPWGPCCCTRSNHDSKERDSVSGAVCRRPPSRDVGSPRAGRAGLPGHTQRLFPEGNRKQLRQ